MTRWFLEHGADPNRESKTCADCRTPLSWAVAFASLDTIKLLFYYGGPESIKHGYLLCNAAYRQAPGRNEILEYLFAKRGLGDINKLEYHDNPTVAAEKNCYFACDAPLHVAASGGYLDTVQLLVACGADPLLPNSK
ncbi:MAG: hypothetical protein Q9224_006437, partial [Gallowayella concinna]